MTKLFKLFFDIALLRAAPQDIPSSTFLSISSVVLYALLSATISAIELPLPNAILSALVDTGLLIALAHVSLSIAGASERKTQTVTALAGTGALVQLLAWPTFFWLSHTEEAKSALLFIPQWALLLLVLWNIVIIAHILRHALSLSLPMTIGISVLYTYFSIRMASILFIAASST